MGFFFVVVDFSTFKCWGYSFSNCKQSLFPFSSLVSFKRLKLIVTYSVKMILQNNYVPRLSLWPSYLLKCLFEISGLLWVCVMYKEYFEQHWASDLLLVYFFFIHGWLIFEITDVFNRIMVDIWYMWEKCFRRAWQIKVCAVVRSRGIWIPMLPVYRVRACGIGRDFEDITSWERSVTHSDWSCYASHVCRRRYMVHKYTTVMQLRRLSLLTLV